MLAIFFSKFNFLFSRCFYLQLTKKEFRKIIKNAPEGYLDVKKFQTISRLYGLCEEPASIFSLENLTSFQNELGIKIRIYQFDADGVMYPYYAPVITKSTKTRIINILISTEPEFREEITDFRLIINEKIIPKIYICRKLLRCNYSTNKYSNFKRHSEKCPDCSTQKIYSKLMPYGVHAGPLEQLIVSGYLPKEAKNFRKTKFITYDIEAIEEKTGIMTKKSIEVAQHKILSIAIGTSDGFEWSKHRKNSSPEAAFDLIEMFLDKLRDLVEDYSTQYPDMFYEALEILESDLTNASLSKAKKSYLSMLKRYLEKYLLMDIYSFNGGRYDLNVLAPYILPSLAKRFNNVRLLKKGSSYFSIETENICFKDVLHFTTPQKLEKYLRQNGVEEAKSIFPYTLFGSIEEMISTKDFPAQEKFYSELKSTNVSSDDYNLAKREFERRMSLPDNNSEKMRNFADWLLFYNQLDCTPLAKAINLSFSKFFESFGVDPSWCLSLPKYAQICMFDSYDPNAPLSYSFGKNMNKIRELFRNNLLGGLVNCFHRMTDLLDSPNVPLSAKIAPNGKPFSRICFFDFNSLYLFCQQLSFPTTPGILWSVVRKGLFRKQIMSTGNSFGALQWILYMNQTHSALTDSNGKRISIEHQYDRGEYEISGFFIDGHAYVDGKHLFYEFLGC